MTFNELNGMTVLQLRKLAREHSVVLGAGICYVDEMIRHFAVFGEVLACAYVHAAVHLTRVGRDYFALQPFCREFAGQPHCIAGLSGCGRAKHADEFNLPVEAGFSQGCKVKHLGLRQFCG